MPNHAKMAIDVLDRELQSNPRSMYEYEHTYPSCDFYLKKAVLKADLPRAELYLRYGGSPNPMVIKKAAKVKWADWFPLEWAVLSGKLEMVELLLQFGADVNAKGRGTRRLTALRLAVENQEVAIVRKLLSVGACPESYEHHYGTAKGRESRDTTVYCDIPVLYDAVKRNNVEIAEMLLRKGAKPNLPKSYKLSYSYLTEAIRAESPEMVALLLQFGADANFEVPNLGTMPLMLAAKAKKHAVDMVKLLVHHGANVNAQELVHKRQDALVIAVLNKDPDLVRVLLQLGARANATESAPLSAAATVESPSGASVEILNLLLDHGAEVNGCDPSGVEPLFASVEKLNTAIVEALLKRGAKVELVHGDMTPLKLAVLSGNEKLVRLLLRHGASPTARVFAPAVINGRREICSSAVTLAMERGSPSTIPASLNDPQTCEPEPAPAPAPGSDDEEKRPIAAPLPPPLSAVISRDAVSGRLQPITSSKEASSEAGTQVEVKRAVTRAMLCVTWALCHQAGRSLYCEWELVAPELDQLTASVGASSYQPVRREPMDRGVIIARGRTAVSSVAVQNSNASTAPGGRTTAADWHNDGFKLSTGITRDDSAKAKAMAQENQRSLRSCELRFRVKTEGGFLSASKTVGEAWFQLSQLEMGVPPGTTAKFLVELSYKKKRTGTMAVELTY